MRLTLHVISGQNQQGAAEARRLRFNLDHNVQGTFQISLSIPCERVTHVSETELQMCVWSCQSGTMVQLQRKDGNSHSCWLQTRLSGRCRGACRSSALWRSPAGIWGLYPSVRGIIHHSITLSLAFNLPRYQPVWVSGGV